MLNLYKSVVSIKKETYPAVVIPVLLRMSYTYDTAFALLNNNQVRVRWGNDWNDFTLCIENPNNMPVWPMDNLIYKLWNNEYVKNREVITLFISTNQYKQVTSLAITDLYTLAENFKLYGKRQVIRNRNNNTVFLTLPFSHQSLFNKVRGFGIRSRVYENNIGRSAHPGHNGVQLAFTTVPGV